jgi:ornithine carbamoyltransferase
MNHLTSLLDITVDDVRHILQTSSILKSESMRGKRRPLLAGKVLVQLFEKPSLRTRLSFEAAMMHLGGSSIFLSNSEAGLNGREKLEDVARVVGGYADVIVLRTFSQQLIETFAKVSGKPVINGLSDDYHPCQALTDLFTLDEEIDDLTGHKVTYVGDGNNVAASLAVGCAMLGVEYIVAAPQGYQLKDEFLNRIRSMYPRCQISQTTDPYHAVKGTHCVYTDVWASMGQEAEKDDRQKVFQDYQVNAALMAAAGPQAWFLHCLPARRGLEVTDEVMDGPQSLVFPQAENRMHVAKGVLAWAMDVNL